MSEERSNPEKLLEQLSLEEKKLGRGKLKIFFGYAPGVGKTYGMLLAAKKALEEGIDVVVGYIEPHQRPETLGLIEGLPIIPPKEIQIGSTHIKEFDLDNAIKRKPQLMIVDELAHTNAKGCRHLKRYQDVEELLRMGVDVYTTVNVQHIESLNDIVESISGIEVRERIPDRLFDEAHWVEIMDIEPEELIQRLNSGKIYQKPQVKKALENFFTIDNLVALREIALRRMADRINLIVEKNKVMSNEDYRTDEHILLCISDSATNQKVIRTAARMADALHGTLTAIFVETEAFERMSKEDKKQLNDNLRLAEQLGAKIATAYGEDIPYQIAEYAKVSSISKIVVGRSSKKTFYALNTYNFIDRLIAYGPDIEIFVIPIRRKALKKRIKHKFKLPDITFGDTAKTLFVLLLSTLVGFWFYNIGFSESNIITVYILGTLFTAVITDGKGYSLASSILAVLMFNFFFTEPRFSFLAYNPGYPVTFLVMFLSAFITSTFTKRVKEQAQQSALKAHRTEVLLDTNQKLVRASNREAIYKELMDQIENLLNRTVIFYPVEKNNLGNPLIKNVSQEANDYFLTKDEEGVAQWVLHNNKNAGATTNTLRGAKCLYLAIRSNDTVFAVVGVAMNHEGIDAFDKNLLVALLNEGAMALEKEKILKVKNEISLKASKEELRLNLLRAVSHDLRTPLTGISGNANLLINNTKELSEEKKSMLYLHIYDDAMWLINLVENLLYITRFGDGTVNLKLEKELISEIISDALNHVNRKVSEHQIKVVLENELTWVEVDARLIIQVIINLVDNAIKYTPKGSEIMIQTKVKGPFLEVQVKDNGDGLSHSEKEKIFDMFYTTNNQRSDSRRGIGIGLALCKSIIDAHEGRIYVMDNHPKGIIFAFTLVLSQDR